MDYDSGPYIVTFLAGQTIATVNITIKDDNVVETNEIFTLNIISPSPFITVTIDQATVTIVDNDRELWYNAVYFCHIYHDNVMTKFNVV